MASVSCGLSHSYTSFPFLDTISTSRIAAEELLHSGYQPSRTLVLSLMLGDVSRLIL